MARFPTRGVLGSPQGQPCQGMPGATNPSCLLTWKVLVLFSSETGLGAAGRAVGAELKAAALQGASFQPREL